MSGWLHESGRMCQEPCNGNVPSDRVDIYNGATGTWEPYTQLSVARSGLAGATLGDMVYFAGGWAASGVSDRIDIYDSSTGTWSTDSLSLARTDLAAAAVGTKILFGGGWTDSAPTPRVDIYDSSTSTWTTTSLSKGRGRLSAVTVGSKILFAGGESVTTGDEDVVDIYDDSTGTWSTTTLSAPREFLGATVLGPKAFFAGGWDGKTGLPSSRVDIYDDISGVWSTASLQFSRWGLAATTVDDRAMFAGGANTMIIHATVEVYEPPNIYPYCSGDPGAGTPCPCGNDNDSLVPYSGCANGVYSSGARLFWLGEASVSADTLVLKTTGMEPSNSGLYFQANNDLSPGSAWGDGLRCAGGQLKRLGVVFATGAGVSDTSGFALPISVKAGNIQVGDTKYYQCWYRNPLNSPCGGEFNTSNGLSVTWLP